MVYIGASDPLAAVPWDAEHPAFHVVPLNDDERALRGHFTVRHVVYAGAHGGCGCGFLPARGPEAGDPETERANRKASLAAFASYLRTQLEQHPKIELHVCKDGGVWEVPAIRRELTPDDLESEDFLFLHTEHSVIVAAHSATATVAGP